MSVNPVTASPERGMAAAIQFMERHRVDSLIIVGKKRELLGYVSIFNVLQGYRHEDSRLADIMKPFVHVVESGTPVALALTLMNEHGLPYVPVVRDGQLVGLVTRGSVVRHMAEMYNPDDMSLEELTAEAEKLKEEAPLEPAEADQEGGGRT
jgi:osmoprotectant transport system ATP-binding protein